MRATGLALSLLLLLGRVSEVSAQQPQAPADSAAAEKAAADSAAERAERDSLAAEIARELGVDTTAVGTPADTLAAAGARPPAGGAGGAVAPGLQGVFQSLNPDISVLGDFLVDLSPKEATTEEGDRFQMREVELGFQAIVDPYVRGDFFLGLKEGEIELEEGYLTTLALPHGLQVKAGRFHLPYGKTNLTHRPEIRTVEYPRFIQEYFGDDGLATAGVWVSKILSPLGFYQELMGVVGNDLGEAIRGEGEIPEGEEDGADGEADGEAEDDDDLINDLGNRLFLGHLKNYWDLTEAANLEIGFSAATGEDRPGEVLAEQLAFYGFDATYRWRPPAAAIYKSVVLQAEGSWRDGDLATDFGLFVLGQYQFGRRWYVGGRYDYVQHPAAEFPGPVLPEQPPGPGDDDPFETENTFSGYLTFVPSEFSLFRLTYEHQGFDIAEDLDRVLLQAVVTLGPHRPHPF